MKPWRKIVSTNEGGDTLDCGHKLPSRDGITLARQRQCYLCQDPEQTKGYPHERIIAAKKQQKYLQKFGG